MKTKIQGRLEICDTAGWKLPLPVLARSLLLVGLFLGSASGCEQKPPPAAATKPPTTNIPRESQIHLNEAQPKLPVIKLWIGAEELKTEVASKPSEHATGMMFRKSIAEDEAMLFVFPHASPRGFYMKNTTVPLSIAYINQEGKILEIHDLHPLELSPVESRASDIQFALETSQGWFKKHHVGVGTVIRSPKGSLQETFFGSR